MNNHYLYTETAFHHEGDIDYVKGLIDATKEAGAEGIKFQVLTKVSDFISSKHSAFEALSNYCFDFSQWKVIFEYTKNKGLDIIMMPLNLDALKLLEFFDIKYLDIHSVSFYDESLLAKIKETSLDIILGVGGRTIEEIAQKKKYFGGNLKVLMVGFQSFPSEIEKVKIGKISFLKTMFPDLEIGYADHSSFDNPWAVKSNEYARLLGATIFEKHITLSEGKERVDYSAAINGKSIHLVKENLNFIDQFVLSDFVSSFEFTKEETTYRERQLRCVASRKINKGEKIEREHIKLKLTTETEESVSNMTSILGKFSSEEIACDELITHNKLI